MTSRIRYASDLHIDINKKYNITEDDIIKRLNLDNIDILILAGDVAEYPRNLEFAREILSRYSKLHIIEVPGNHLYYSCSRLLMSMNEIDRACRSFGKNNTRYHFLNKDSVQINGISFIGATMWTKLGERLGHVMSCVRALNDFRLILNDNYQYLTYSDVIGEHNRARKYIFDMCNNTQGKKIVITHHAPFCDMISPISHAFGIDMNRSLCRLKNFPDYWVYGHTHINQDKILQFAKGHVDCVTNQMGYKGENEWDERFNAWETFDNNKEIVL